VDTEPEFFLLGEQPQGRRAWKKRKIQRGADTNTKEEEEECESGTELPFYTFHFSLFTFHFSPRAGKSGFWEIAIRAAIYISFYILPFTLP
jgi:hypothetical protein